MRSIVTIVCVLLMPLASAQNLVEFENGQVADADDLNQNLAFLLEKIEALEAASDKSNPPHVSHIGNREIKSADWIATEFFDGNRYYYGVDQDGAEITPYIGILDSSLNGIGSFYHSDPEISYYDHSWVFSAKIKFVESSVSSDWTKPSPDAFGPGDCHNAWGISIGPSSVHVGRGKESVYSYQMETDDRFHKYEMRFNPNNPGVEDDTVDVFINDQPIFIGWRRDEAQGHDLCTNNISREYLNHSYLGVGSGVGYGTLHIKVSEINFQLNRQPPDTIAAEKVVYTETLGDALQADGLTFAAVSAANAYVGQGATTGKHYWEITAQCGPDTGGVGMGVIGADSLPTSLDSPGDDNWISIFSDGARLVRGDTVTNFDGNLMPTAANDVFSIAVDLSEGSIFFGKNGIWAGGADPATNSNPAFQGLFGAYHPFIGGRGRECLPNTFVTNFGASPFIYDVPSGYFKGYCPDYDCEVAN